MGRWAIIWWDEVSQTLRLLYHIVSSFLIIFSHFVHEPILRVIDTSIGQIQSWDHGVAGIGLGQSYL